jgi:hypothetical protein
MNAIHIRRTLDSDVLHLPELKPLIGKTVEIIVREETPPIEELPDRWKPLLDAAGRDLVDPEAYKQQREFDRLNWKVEEI